MEMQMSGLCTSNVNCDLERTGGRWLTWDILQSVKEVVVKEVLVRFSEWHPESHFPTCLGMSEYTGCFF